MKTQPIYVYYIIDLITIIKSNKSATEKKAADDFDTGKISGYNNALLYIQQKALELGIQIDFPLVETIRNVDINDALYQQLTQQLTNYLLEQLKIAKKQPDDFSGGALMAYYDMLTIIKQQAQLLFHIPLHQIGLKNKNLENLAFAQPKSTNLQQYIHTI